MASQTDDDAMKCSEKNDNNVDKQKEQRSTQAVE